MSQEKVIQAFNGGIQRTQPKQEITATQALTQGIKEGVGAFVNGMGKVFDIAQGSPTVNSWMSHGAIEIVSVLNGNGLPIYGHSAQHDQAKQPSPEVSQPQIQRSRGLSL